MSGTADSEKDVSAVISYPFPFPPYPIQSQLMAAVHGAIKGGNVGIFESPTGTGKSLSVICSSLYWLKNEAPPVWVEEGDNATLLTVTNGDGKENGNNNISSATGDAASSLSSSSVSSKPSWMMDFKKKKLLQAMEERKRLALDLKAKLEERLVTLRDNIHKNKRRHYDDHHRSSSSLLDLDSSSASVKSRGRGGDGDGEGDLVLDDYNSDGDKEKGDIRYDAEEDDMDGGKRQAGSDISLTKIIYCSRTHSQLTQFLQEIHKTSYADNVKCVPLASRKSLCINEKVNRIKNEGILNDKCIDMQRNKTDASYDKGRGSCCRYYDKGSQYLFTDHTLVKINDIEDLGELGKKLTSCPYYGSRKSIAMAEVVTMPYSMLLHEKTRNSLGISLQGNVVIIDEAHNLIEAINSVHSCSVTMHHIVEANKQLTAYYERYKTRLLGKNVMYIKQILSLLQSLSKYLSKPTAVGATPSPSADGGGKARDTGSNNVSSDIHSINDFVCAANIDNFNLFKIDKFIERSNIAQKLHGFADKYNSEKAAVDALSVSTHSVSTSACDDSATMSSTGNSDYIQKHVSSLQIAHRFLMSLMNAEIDGRVLAERHSANSLHSCYKFVMMNPAVHFNKVVREARSVILLGGTMQPVSDVISQLFAEVPVERISTFTLGHVIPSENICVCSLTTGPSGVKYDFTYESRSTAAQMNELGRLLVNLTTLVPQGIVVFLPSFTYLEQVIQFWKKSGTETQLRTRRQIFFEPREAIKLEGVLRSYETAIEKGGGAVLFSVVGAKMSEGINFNDGLARCVVMVGLPYPNAYDPILKEKMKYLDSKERERGGGVSVTSKSDAMKPPTAGREFYENSCMKAVNQSIGRAIRHGKDYAAIILVDCRYSKNSITSKLPGWISKELKVHDTYGSACKAIGQFFRFHNNKSSQKV